MPANKPLSEPAAPPMHTRVADRRRETISARQASHRAQLDEMVRIAAANHELERGLHRVATALLAERPRDVAAAVARWMRAYFAVPRAAVWLADRARAAAAAAHYEQLRQRVAHLGSICEDRAPRKLLAAWFAAAPAAGEDAVAIASCAFIPLAYEGNLYGVLALGSPDKTRFQPGMGAEILDRLGQLLGAYLAGAAAAGRAPDGD